MTSIPLDEVISLLEGLQEEQRALHRQKAHLLKQRDAIDQELKEMEVRFHRGAGGVLTLNQLCNMYGEFPHLKAGEGIMEAYNVPTVPDEKMEQHLEWRELGPEGLDEEELTRRREAVYKRQADDWVAMLDRRSDEDHGPGSALGAGGSANGTGGPEGQESVGSEPDQRQLQDGRSP